MDALGIDVWKLLFQIIAFVIFIFLLNKYAMGPIVRMLDERQQKVQDSMEAAQMMQTELAATTAKNEEILAEARREAQAILASARESGDATIARAQTEADRQANEYLTRAQAALQSETEAARLLLRQEIGDLAVQAASRIVRKELDPAAQARVIEEALSEASASAKSASSLN